jgi:hypothetical protein
MLADPRQSRIVLINPARGIRHACAEATTRMRAGLALLPAVIDIFAIPVHAAGEVGHDGSGDESAPVFRPIDTKSLSLWQDPALAQSGGMSEASVVFLAGAWLEEEVLIAALEGVRRGHDIRLLADLSVARLEIDRNLALDRLAMHGVPAMTLRQALLEWAAYVEDPSVSEMVRRSLA